MNTPISTEQYKKLIKKADKMSEEWAKNNPTAQRQADFSTGLSRMLDVVFFAEDKEIFDNETTNISINKEQVKMLKDLLNNSEEGKHALAILGL